MPPHSPLAMKVVVGEDSEVWAIDLGSSAMRGAKGPSEIILLCAHGRAKIRARLSLCIHHLPHCL